jgi:hypothetical protein
MFEKLWFMRAKLSQLFSKGEERRWRVTPSVSVKLALESLEGRVLPALYLWVGGADNLASDSANWWVQTAGGAWASPGRGVLPGAADDVLFAQGAVPGANNAIPGNSCIWDPKAPGVVHSIDIGLVSLPEMYSFLAA